MEQLNQFTFEFCFSRAVVTIKMSERDREREGGEGKSKPLRTCPVVGRGRYGSSFFFPIFLRFQRFLLFCSFFLFNIVVVGQVFTSRSRTIYDGASRFINKDVYYIAHCMFGTDDSEHNLEEKERKRGRDWSPFYEIRNG